MAVLDDIRDGKGLKPITFNCFTCQNDNCIANSAKIITYQCRGYKHKETNADRVRSMTNAELVRFFDNLETKNYFGEYLGELGWLEWLKEEV